MSFLQVLTCILLLPFSRSAYRRVNRFLMELLWSEPVWLMDWWAGVKVQTRSFMYKEQRKFLSLSYVHCCILVSLAESSAYVSCSLCSCIVRGNFIILPIKADRSYVHILFLPKSTGLLLQQSIKIELGKEVFMHEYKGFCETHTGFILFHRFGFMWIQNHGNTSVSPFLCV